VKNFLFIYFFTLVFLFGAFYWDASPIANTINQWQINLSSLLSSLTLENNIIQDNHIFINPNLTLIIDKECNGFIPYFFFLASILAFPSSIKDKVKWAIFGYLLLSTLNVFRIWFITQLVISSENNFSLAHDYLGNFLLIFSALFLFIGFIKSQ
jgi:exosortase/archaeosortase family protein